MTRKAWLLLGAPLVLAAAGVSADELNMPLGVTEISRSIYDLHMTIFTICVIIGVLVFGAMFWSMLHHRKSLGVKPATFHENTQVEFAWTIIPFVILVGIAFPATSTLVALYDTGGEDLLIETKAYQWKWEYKYVGEDFQSEVSYFSTMATPQAEIHNQTAKGEHYLLEVDEPLVIPVGKKVRFLVTSNDVIHAFWVPEFGIKRDAVPGFVNELFAIVDEPGVYRGQCTELCGKDHGFMPIVVRAVSQADYDTWYAGKLAEAEAERELTSKEWTADELYARGEGVYAKFCASCHQAGGQGVPPVFPALKGSAIALGPKEDHIRIVQDGAPGTAMAAFGNQLNPVDMAAVIHYERHAWGNNANDVTTPQDILAYVNADK